AWWIGRRSLPLWRARISWARSRSPWPTSRTTMSPPSGGTWNLPANKSRPLIPSPPKSVGLSEASNLCYGTTGPGSSGTGAGADARGFLSTDAADERHERLFLPSRCGRQGALRKDSAAALRFPVHHLKLFLAQGRQVHDVSTKTFPVGAVLRVDTGELLSRLG